MAARVVSSRTLTADGLEAELTTAEPGGVLDSEDAARTVESAGDTGAVPEGAVNADAGAAAGVADPAPDAAAGLPGSDAGPHPVPAATHADGALLDPASLNPDLVTPTKDFHVIELCRRDHSRELAKNMLDKFTFISLYTACASHDWLHSFLGEQCVCVRCDCWLTSEWA